jgi:hypothetical protein
MEDPHEQIKIKMKLIFVIANQYSVGGPEIDALWEDAWLEHFSTHQYDLFKEADHAA